MIARLYTERYTAVERWSLFTSWLYARLMSSQKHSVDHVYGSVLVIDYQLFALKILDNRTV